MQKMLAFILTLLFAAQAPATTLVIVTDQAKAPKAREVAALFRSTEPYSLMKDLKVKVIQTSSSKLGCSSSLASSQDIVASDKTGEQAAAQVDFLARSEWRSRAPQNFEMTLPASCSDKGSPISRLISCDTPQAVRYLNALAKTEKTKFIVVVKTDARYGGSGGARVVITTGSPASMAIHELMHQLGFADEYAYTNACEADIYCGDTSDNFKSASGYGNLPGTSFNVALFNASSNYTSDSDARAKHANTIPWLSFIDAKTPLTASGKLGTPSSVTGFGLYRSIVCDKASRRQDTWQSIPSPTIMRTLTTTFIPKDYWPTIAKSLGTHL